MPRSTVALSLLVFMVLTGGCGRGQSPDGATTGAGATPGSHAAGARAEDDSSDTRSEKEQERLDAEIDEAVDALDAAASRGDRTALATAEQRLSDLTARQPAVPSSKNPDAFGRFLEDFPFKAPPLYVRQLLSDGEGHRVFAAVSHPQYCLWSRSRRRKAIGEVYAPAAGTLRQAGIRDFVFVVVPLRDTLPTMKRALAIGRQGKLKFTKAGRAC